MQWQATIYQMMVSDYLMPAPGAGEKRFVNADQTTHQGLELSGKVVKQHLGYFGLAAGLGQFKFN